MDVQKTIIEVRWNSIRQHYDVRREGEVLYFHEMKGRALAIARKIAHDLLLAGEHPEIVVIDTDGFHIKDRFCGQGDDIIGQPVPDALGRNG